MLRADLVAEAHLALIDFLQLDGPYLAQSLEGVDVAAQIGAENVVLESSVHPPIDIVLVLAVELAAGEEGQHAEGRVGLSDAVHQIEQFRFELLVESLFEHRFEVDARVVLQRRLEK